MIVMCNLVVKITRCLYIMIERKINALFKAISSSSKMGCLVISHWDIILTSVEKAWNTIATFYFGKYRFILHACYFLIISLEFFKAVSSLPQKEVHEEDYAEEEHGQPAANLGDDGKLVKVRARNGFIKGSLQRARTLLRVSPLQESGWLITVQRKLKIRSLQYEVQSVKRVL